MKNVIWFGSADICKQADISLRQLYYWELKGIVTPRFITQGSRQFKRYSMKDLAVLQQVKSLLDEGFTLQSASLRARRENEDA